MLQMLSDQPLLVAGKPTGYCKKLDTPKYVVLEISLAFLDIRFNEVKLHNCFGYDCSCSVYIFMDSYFNLKSQSKVEDENSVWSQ